MNKHQQAVIDYYHHLESRLGYTYITWNTKHFGYHPTPKNPLHEKKAQEYMQDLLAKNLDLKKGQTVLDAGCGRGTVAIYLARKYNVHIKGIDLVPIEINTANTLKEKNNISDSQVIFFVGDYSQTSFKNDSFDAVYTMETLVHSPNIEKTLKEFYRVLKPGGLLALFEYTIAPLNTFLKKEREMFDIVVKGSAMTSLPVMFHDITTNYIQKTGFTNVTAQEITDYVGPSAKRFYNLAKYPYKIIKMLHMQDKFVNTTAAIEFYHLAEKGLFKYRIFTAQKPK